MFSVCFHCKAGSASSCYHLILQGFAAFNSYSLIKVIQRPFVGGTIAVRMKSAEARVGRRSRLSLCN